MAPRSGCESYLLAVNKCTIFTRNFKLLFKIERTTKAYKIYLLLLHRNSTHFDIVTYIEMSVI